MAFTIVQQKSSTPNATTLTLTLDDPVTPGNLLVCGIDTSSSINPANDEWTRAEFDTDFIGLYAFYQVAANSSSGTITRTMPVADRTNMWIAEVSGAGAWEVVLDDSTKNKPSENGAGSISSGTTTTLSQPDGWAIAFFGVSRNVSGGTSSFTGYTNGFSEVAEVVSTGGDAPILAVATKQLGSGIDPVETTASLSSFENRPMGIILVFKAPPPVDVRAKLSGGSNNASAAASLGGVRSSVQASSDIFNNVSRLQADTGQTDYRLIYVTNLSDSMSASVVAFIDVQLTGTQSLAIAVSTEGVGATVASIGSSTSVPSGVSFSAPSTVETGLDLGTLGPGQSRGLWLRRTITALINADPTNPWHIALEVSPV